MSASPIARSSRPPSGMTPLELTRRIDQVALAEVGSLNRIVRSDESATVERIDTLESEDRDCDPVDERRAQRSQVSASGRHSRD